MSINREGEYPTGSERYFTSKYNRLRYKFPGSEKISENYSQSMQDLFVLSMLDGKKDGVYVEIGADKPVVINCSPSLISAFLKRFSVKLRVKLRL